MTIQLDQYRTFDNAAELNEAIRLHLREHKYELNKTAFSVLETISRYAVKYAGAAWLKLDTLSGIVGKSKPSVRRAIALLEKLGVVERIPFMRPKSGGNGGNIIRILPPNDRPEMIARDTAENPCEIKEEAANQPNESKVSKISNTLLKDTYPAVTFYQQFKKFIFSTIGEEQPIVSKLYGVYMAHTKRLKENEVYSSAELEHAGYEALRASVMATKRKTIKNLAGYYHGTLDRMLDQLYLSYINKAPSDDGAGAD